jgi:hypothetical protein
MTVSSSVVEHPLNHPKVKGLSPVASGTGKENEITSINIKASSSSTVVEHLPYNTRLGG